MKVSKELLEKGLSEYLRIVDTSILDTGEVCDLISEPAVLVSAMIELFKMDVQYVADGEWVAYSGYGDGGEDYGDIGEGSNHWEAVINDFICVSQHLEDKSE